MASPSEPRRPKARRKRARCASPSASRPRGWTRAIPSPPDRNAVVMIEHVHTVGDVEIELMAAVAPWQHVRPMGEDIVATELVLPAGKVLTPVDLGAIAASGHTRVHVRRRPRVAVLPT